MQIETIIQETFFIYHLTLLNELIVTGTVFSLDFWAHNSEVEQDKANIGNQL